MKTAITGADGFVGRWLCAELHSAGHKIVGGVHEATPALSEAWHRRLEAVEWVPLDLLDRDSVASFLATKPDAVVHLAAVSSGAQARSDPVGAWQVNCLGTCTLVYGLERLAPNARLILASTGEVYGAGLTRPARENDPVVPCSPYAASKAGAEIAVQEYHRRCRGDVIVTRPFAQTGPGQRDAFIVPALARRILHARRTARRTIPVGNLDPVREFLDVRDLATAIRTLLEHGVSGTVYNVCRGQGIRLMEVVELLVEVIGWEVQPEPDPALFRAADIPYLVGDGARIREAGWTPRFELRTTLADLVSGLDKQDRTSLFGHA